MKARYRYLSLLLLAQLVLASGLYWGGQLGEVEHAPRPLVEVAAVEVDRLVIGDGESEAILSRVGDAWQVPELSGLPADEPRVTTLLRRLARATVNWPVTTTAGSHERFDVADEGFQRRVQLFSADTVVGGFYLGSSPGFRQVHLRGFDQDEVYSVEMNVSDFPASDDDWLDKALLAVSAPTRIEAGDYSLVASAKGSWELAQEIAAGEGSAPELDAERAERLAFALSSLRVQGVADVATVPDDVGKVGRKLRVDADEGSLDFLFYTKDGSYYVSRSDIAATFSLSQYDYDRIAGVGLAELAAESSTEEASEPVQEQAVVVEEQASQG